MGAGALEGAGGQRRALVGGSAPLTRRGGPQACPGLESGLSRPIGPTARALAQDSLGVRLSGRPPRLSTRNAGGDGPWAGLDRWQVSARGDRRGRDGLVVSGTVTVGGGRDGRDCGLAGAACVVGLGVSRARAAGICLRVACVPAIRLPGWLTGQAQLEL